MLVVVEYERKMLESVFVPGQLNSYHALVLDKSYFEMKIHQLVGPGPTFLSSVYYVSLVDLLQILYFATRIISTSLLRDCPSKIHLCQICTSFLLNFYEIISIFDIRFIYQILDLTKIFLPDFYWFALYQTSTKVKISLDVSTQIISTKFLLDFKFRTRFPLFSFYQISIRILLYPYQISTKNLLDFRLLPHFYQTLDFLPHFYETSTEFQISTTFPTRFSIFYHISARFLLNF